MLILKSAKNAEGAGGGSYYNVKIMSVDVIRPLQGWRNFLVKTETDFGLVGWDEGTLEWKEAAVRELVLDFGRR